MSRVSEDVIAQVIKILRCMIERDNSRNHDMIIQYGTFRGKSGYMNQEIMTTIHYLPAELLVLIFEHLNLQTIGK